MSMDQEKKISRRDWLASVLMGAGLLASYGTLAWQTVSFLLPGKAEAKKRKLFAGRIESYPQNSVQTFSDLQGNEILVKRDQSGFRAFSSTCPHLGCRVRWKAENDRFFCPCHRGVFNPDGIAIAGPPADGNQNLAQVPIEVDRDSGVVYLAVKDIES